MKHWVASLDIGHSKLFMFIFVKLQKEMKTKLRGFLQKNYEKKINTWNIRHLVDESFVQATQRTNVFYCRLSDLDMVACLCGPSTQRAALSKVSLANIC